MKVKSKRKGDLPSVERGDRRQLKYLKTQRGFGSSSCTRERVHLASSLVKGQYIYTGRYPWESARHRS
jgi:hypothetical protein